MVTKQRVAAPQLASYEAKLGLSWPVSYFVVPGERTCHIVCDPGSRAHEVWAYEGAMSSFEFFLPDLVHELCHAAIAERVDTVFSTICFGPEALRISREQPEEFARRSSELHLAQAHVDAWVNDLRHSLWPELTRQDYQSFSQITLAMARQGQWDALRQPTTILGLALNQAEVARHHLRPIDLSPVFRGLGPEVKDFIAKVARFYGSLPRLQYNREQDLKNYAASVQKAAKILGLSIRPRLIEGEKQAEWEV